MKRKLLLFLLFLGGFIQSTAAINVVMTGYSVPINMYPGGSYTIAVDLQNTGTTSTPSSFIVNVSINSSSTYDGGQTWLADIPVSTAIPASGTRHLTTSITIPCSYGLGVKYILLYANPIPHTFTESTYSDNMMAPSILVHTAPDLRPYVYPTSLGTVSAGSSLTVGSSVQNNGCSSTGSGFNVGFYLSTTPTLVIGSASFLGSYSASTLPAGSISSVVNTTLSIPSGLCSGPYYLFIYVDNGTTITETDETNNFQYATVTVNGLSAPAIPSLTASTLSSSSIQLSWPSVSGATSYFVYYSSSACLGDATIHASPTSSPFTVTGLPSSTTYYCNIRANNLCGTSFYSNCAMATTSSSCTSPTISTEPSDASVTAPSGTAFSVSATGSGVSYQWQLSTDGGFSWSNISTGGIYTTSLNILFVSSTSSSMNGYKYRCIVSNSCGTVTSSAGTLTIGSVSCIPPSILSNPSDQAVTPSAGASFSVSLTGTSLTYQWQLSTNGGASWSPISSSSIYSGVNSSTLSIFSTSVGMNGYKYRCFVSNSCGSIISSSATLTVASSCAPVFIVTHPTSVVKSAGTNATFVVVAGGTSPFTYQWYRNGSPISGANTSSYTTSTLTTAHNGYTYYCHVTNCSGSSVNSITAILTVNPGIPPITVNTGANTQSKIIGEPINAATGVNFTSHTDFKIPDRNTFLDFTRYYSTANNTVDSGIGYGWSHTYNYYIINYADTLWVLHFGDGHSSYYIPNEDGLGGSASLYNGVYEKLTKNPSTGIFTLKLKTGETYLFNAINKLSSITDLNGNTTSLSYSGGKLVSVVAPSGRSLSFTYSGSHISSVIDPLTRIVNYTYDGAGNLISASNPDTGSTKYTYNALHLLSVYVLPQGDTLFTNHYDSNNRVDTQTDAQHLITTLAYNYPSAGYTTVTYSNGTQTVVLHDSLYRLIKETDQLGLVKYTVYDANNNVDGFKDESNKTYVFTLDALGNVTKIILPTGITTSFIFDTLCRPKVAINPMGSADTIYYDEQENIAKIILPNSATVRYNVDSYGQVDTITNALNNKTSFHRNVHGDITSIISPSGTKSFEYDAAGRVATYTNENGIATHLFYNNRDKITKIVDVYGDSVTYIYDANYNLICYTDKMGYQTHWIYDVKDRLIKKIDAQGGVTTIAYDSIDNVRAITDANSHTTTFTHNAKNQLTGFSNSLGSVRFGLDSVGNVIADTDAISNITTYHFDSVSRMDAASDPLGNTWHFLYDSAMHLIASTDPMSRTTMFEYNNVGLLDEVIDAKHHPTSIGYDLKGRKTSISDPNTHIQKLRYYPSDLPSSITSPMGYVDSFIYDAVGNATAHVLPNGAVITQVRDSLNRIKQINVPGNTSSFSYNKNNKVTTYHNNTGTSSLLYDSTNRLKKYTDMYGDSVRYTRDSLGNVLTVRGMGDYLVTYTYDENNMPLTVTDWLGHVTKYFYDPNGKLTMQVNTAINDTCKYEYDIARRRTSIIHTIGPKTVYKRNFTLNADGEITNTAILAGRTPKHFHADTVNIDYNDDDGINHVSSATYTHDSSGNLTVADTCHFAFSPDNQLLSIDTSINYCYDALHNRVKMTQNGVATILVLDLSGNLSQVLQEKDSTGAIKAQYIYGNGQLIAMVDSAGIHYFLFDESHNTIALTNDTGLVTDTYTYLPFGKVVNHTGTSQQHYTFLGQFGVTQETASIYFLRARYYNAVNHSFLSKDPYPATIINPQSLNRYVYALNNPVSIFDPSGLNGECDDNWDLYKNNNPISAGIVDGFGNFITGTVTGLGYMILHPINTLTGIGNVAQNAILHPVNTVESVANASMQAVNTFENADAYTRSEMLTEGGLFAGSFFVGGGEAEAAAETATSEEIAVHGNSLNSTRPTWGYKLYSEDGTFLKNGITSNLNAESRYSKEFMSDKYMEKELFSNRRSAYNWEYNENMTNPGPLNFENYLNK